MTPDSRTWVKSFIGLGSNLPDRLGHLQAAVNFLVVHSQIQVESCSEIFESEFVGPGEQAAYLNACVGIRTCLTSFELLEALKKQEQAQGRQKNGHMLPRPVDLDILLYHNEVRCDSELTLPHPRLTERAFVLVPLAQIASEEEIPDSGETVTSACAKIRQKSEFWLQLCAEMSLRPMDSAASKED